MQFRVSHLPQHRSSVPLRFELIIGAVLAAMLAGETLREFRGQYTQLSERVSGVHWIADLLRRNIDVCSWPVIPFADVINKRFSGCAERQVTDALQSYSRDLYKRSVKEKNRPGTDIQ